MAMVSVNGAKLETTGDDVMRKHHDFSKMERLRNPYVTALKQPITIGRRKTGRSRQGINSLCLRSGLASGKQSGNQSGAVIVTCLALQISIEQYAMPDIPA